MPVRAVRRALMFAGVLTLCTTACATAFAAGNAIDGDLSTEWGSRDGRIVYKSDWTSATAREQ